MKRIQSGSVASGSGVGGEGRGGEGDPVDAAAPSARRPACTDRDRGLHTLIGLDLARRS